MSPLPFSVSPTQLFAGALNALLRREPWARERLAAHAGKTVRVALGGFTMGLAIGPEGQVQGGDPAAAPDVILAIAPEKLSLSRLRAHKDPADSFMAVTHISGDAALAQAVGDVARYLRPDPEDELARVVGDVAAVRLMRGARAAVGGMRDTVTRLAGNTAEYLAEERAVLVGRPLAADWQDAVAQTGAAAGTLSARLADLCARLDRLEREPRRGES